MAPADVGSFRPSSRPARRSVLLGTAGAVAAFGALGGRAAAATPSGSTPTPLTPPEERTGPRAQAWIRRVVARMSVEEKVGQLLVTHVYGAAADSADARNTAEYGVATPAEVVAKYHLGGVCYFTWSGNVGPLPGVAALSNGLQAAATGTGAGLPLLISTDQEQGTIARIGPPATQFPGNMALGAGRDAAAAREAAAITGAELAALGINHDYAPDADVNVDPGNPVIGVRSFGSDPGLVAELAAAQVLGYQRDGGVAATAKHFPGHGDTKVDSHTGIPEIRHTRQQWESLDAPPFRAVIEAGIDSIMTGHLVFPALDPSGDPATLSRPIVTGLLREELGFTGLVVTDALGMKGVRDKYGDDQVVILAINAGVDMLLRPPAFDLAHRSLLAAVRSGRISRHRLDEAVGRIIRLKLANGIVHHPAVDVSAVADTVGTPAHLDRADRITEATTTVVRNAAGLLPARVDRRRLLVAGAGGSAVQYLAGALADRGAETRTLSTGTRPTDAAIAGAVAAADDADLTVVLTSKAWDTDVTDPQARQRLLVEKLLGTGRPIVVVAVADPYDLAYADRAPACVAVYAPNAVTMRALARVLCGEVGPRGRLPVEIPAADGSGVLYPYGHGLTW
ncbi:beta-N-acetylhexosaminidase [Actinopolymorpha cephalotaxi]|uniref:beta-N-acetylhexosaminidase n=1 Tax=Actinopolymorpha cephalotaxi TaxID=504797 RepID=A0A1I2KL19_9ACTN|nr:glycoside hydrolase family 3 N-terminal domain-containing protein [Actinopolymorpha cephalotaxi]NYH84487.1 beta-N-acetylhexosaminidase [Actinopolymorpha cephalotaxi]SFF67028.1 beta-N-acetylhexosaminidase [Actinopolymorpha cephalotaxi]